MHEYGYIDLPVEALLPMLLCVYHPLVRNTELAIFPQVLVRLFRNGTELEQSLEILKLLVVNVQLEWCWLLACACWHTAEWLC